MGRVFRTLKLALRDKSKDNSWSYWKEELYFSFLKTFYYSWKDPIDRFFETIVRIAKWIPILWKDRDWDHSFILTILMHKIRFQRECLGRNNLSINTKYKCKKMRTTELILQRMIDSDYCRKEYKEHHEKWGPYIKWNQDTDGLWCSPPSDPKEHEEFRKIMKHDAYMQNQDYDYLFKLLKKHLQSWWD